MSPPSLLLLMLLLSLSLENRQSPLSSSLSLLKALLNWYQYLSENRLMVIVEPVQQIRQIGWLIQLHHPRLSLRGKLRLQEVQRQVRPLLKRPSVRLDTLLTPLRSLADWSYKGSHQKNQMMKRATINRWKNHFPQESNLFDVPMAPGFPPRPKRLMSKCRIDRQSKVVQTASRITQ